MLQVLLFPEGVVPLAVCVTALFWLTSLVSVALVIEKSPTLLSEPSSAVNSKPNLPTPECVPVAVMV